MLWRWYSPWVDALHLWEEMTHQYWRSVLSPRRALSDSPNGAHRAGSWVEEQTARETATTAALHGLRVGDRHVFEQTVHEGDLAAFAAASGDCNPLHMDEEYATRTRFGRRIAHGMLSASFISAALATLGGQQATTIYLSQSLHFLRPVVVGDTITTVLEVARVDAPKRRLTVKTECRNERGETVVMGEAIVLLDAYPYAA